MEGQGKSLEELHADLVIDDEDEGGIIVANSEVVQQKQTYVLIGKFLTEKNINFMVMQNVMAMLWRPKEGMEDVEMRVQVYDIPRGLMSENILRSIGTSIGKFVKMDANTLDEIWKSFVRIRVTLNVQKPLKRRVKIKREGDGRSWVNFKYERLGAFCFVCGILGHSKRDCSIVDANSYKVVDRAYGVWLRTPPKNATKLNTGAKWLKNIGAQSNMWKNTTTSMVVQGDNREEARFMEVDGVVRENYGDSGSVAVKGREFRASNKATNTIEDIGGNNMEKENVVCDPKRKRVEDKVEENQEENQEKMSNPIQTAEHLNLQMASPGAQARLGL
ncbi:hypothetical protein AgCh_005694 [Apium graveolens]